MTNQSQTTARRFANARRLLEAAGWTVMPPSPSSKHVLFDQCEYPDRHGSPGDTCVNDAHRNRKTRYGTLWLCPDHFDAPLAELFDERLNHVDA